VVHLTLLEEMSPVRAVQLVYYALHMLPPSAAVKVRTIPGASLSFTLLSLVSWLVCNSLSLSLSLSLSRCNHRLSFLQNLSHFCALFGPAADLRAVLDVFCQLDRGVALVCPLSSLSLLLSTCSPPRWLTSPQNEAAVHAYVHSVAVLIPDQDEMVVRALDEAGTCVFSVSRSLLSWLSSFWSEDVPPIFSALPITMLASRIFMLACLLTALKDTPAWRYY
jgi:hypothetical protein